MQTKAAKVPRGLAKTKGNLTPNGTIHPDNMYVVRHESGSLMQTDHDLKTVLRSSYLYSDNISNDIPPVEVAEYRLVSIKKYDVEITPVEAN